MPDPKNVFVTGATGFLGSHLAFRLLEQGHHVQALARSSKNTSARTRVEETLQSVAGSAELLKPHLARLDVIEGDISQPSLGMNDEARQQMITSTAEVWHCAASLSFSEEDREEIFRMNIGGTEHLLSLVEQTTTRRLQHVSTAYVAGNRPDIAKEGDIDVGQTFKNPYEESKCRSELLVAAAHRHGKVGATIYRPSIVIGDSKTGRVTHFHGVYAFIRGLWTALARIRRRMPEGGTVHLPLRVAGNVSGTLNFVPIDYVVDGMLAIAAQESSLGQTYHLANPVPTPNAVWLPNITRLLGVTGVEIVPESSFAETPMTKMEMLFQRQMAFYYMYLQGEPRFDCSQTQAALKGTGIECPTVTVEFIEKMIGWYVRYLQGEK